MKWYINESITPRLDFSEAARVLRVHEDCLDEFEEIFRRCMKIACPKYCFLQLPTRVSGEKTSIGNLDFDSRILRVNLQGLDRVFVSVASCGRELYNLSNSCTDMLERYWADGIAEILMEQAAAELRSHIRSITGMEIRAMSPGSLEDFPITQQEKLFSLLGELPRRIGVQLTDHCLMLPHKSVSAIYFESEDEYENCMLCLREGCAKRRAAFNEAAFIEKYGLDAAEKPII